MKRKLQFLKITISCSLKVIKFVVLMLRLTKVAPRTLECNELLRAPGNIVQAQDSS